MIFDHAIAHEDGTGPWTIDFFYEDVVDVEAMLRLRCAERRRKAWPKKQRTAPLKTICEIRDSRRRVIGRGIATVHWRDLEHWSRPTGRQLALRRALKEAIPRDGWKDRTAALRRRAVWRFYFGQVHDLRAKRLQLDALRELSTNDRTCPVCRAAFTSARYQTVYCSKRCRWAAQQRRHRARKAAA